MPLLRKHSLFTPTSAHTGRTAPARPGAGTQASMSLLLVRKSGEEDWDQAWTGHMGPLVHLTLSFHLVACVLSQSCPTLYDPMECSLPGFSVHGILQARVLEWVAIPFSGGSS